MKTWKLHLRVRGAGAAVVMSLQVAVADAGETAWEPAERALATAILTAIQPRSIAEGVEFCGYLYHDASGALRATGPVRGTPRTCDAPMPPEGAVASWHTHGAWDPATWNELPSDLDLRSDRYEGVDGWIATPGGRLWHVDGRRMAATLVCGPFCLPSDPDFVQGEEGDIAPFYSFTDLLDRFESE